jgi:hypothetical protein
MSLKKSFTDLWCSQYEQATGNRYLFQGAKDGQAADRLLASKIPWTEIFQVANWAWEHPEQFNAKHAASLAGFASRFNEIRHEYQTYGRTGSGRNANANQDRAVDYAKVGQ